MKNKLLNRRLMLGLLMFIAVAMLWSGGLWQAEAAEQVTIKYYCWYPPDPIMNPLIERFEELHPNIKVEVNKTEPGPYQQKTPVSLASGEQMDLVASFTRVSFVNQIKNFLTPLQPLMDEYHGKGWEQKLVDGVVETCRNYADDGKLYILGQGFLGSPVMYYNASLFREYGLTVPETIADLKQAVETVKSKNPDIMPIVFRGKLPWLHTASAFGMYAQEKELWSVARQGKYNTPEMVEMATWWARLFREDIISKDTLDVDNAMAAELFYTGKAVMMIHGTWMAGLLTEDYRQKNDVQIQEIGAFPFPAITPGNSPTTASTLDLGLGIAKHSKHKKEALELMNFLLFGEGAQMMADNFTLVPVKQGLEVKRDMFATDLAREGYERIRTALANPQNALREFDEKSTPFGKVLQSIVLGQEPKEALDDFQREIDMGKY